MSACKCFALLCFNDLRTLIMILVQINPRVSSSTKAPRFRSSICLVSLKVPPRERVEDDRLLL